MNTPNSPQRAGSGDEAGTGEPPGLGEALRRLYGPGPSPPAVPREVDDRILTAARAQLARRAADGETTRLRRLVPLAAAAGLLIVAGASLTLPGLLRGRGHVTPPPAAPLTATKDLNGDGRVDILDAYRLARALHHAPDGVDALDPAWDVNGDGKVDADDVDTVAAAAVSLTGGDL